MEKDREGPSEEVTLKGRQDGLQNVWTPVQNENVEALV